MTSTIINAVRRFAPWIALVTVYLVLGFAGRVFLWHSFGPEADVGAARLPYVLTAGLVNDLIESLYLFAPLALYILLVPDRWFRSRANRVLLYGGTVADHRGPALPHGGGVVLLRRVRRALQHRRVRLPRVPH